MKIKQQYLLTLSLAGLVGCGGSSDAISSLMASLAITSPAASSVTTLYGTQAEDNGIKPIDEMIEDLKDNLQNSDPNTMAQKVGSFIRNETQVGCYGPVWTDNATGSNVNRPSGDTGMVYDTASNVDTRPCAVAKSNQLVEDKGGLVNNIINLQATAILAANGDEPTDVGQEKDVLASMPTIPGLTLTAVKLKRLADDADGNKVYKTHFDFSENSKTGSIDVYHTPLNSDNTSFKGLIQAVLPHTATMSGAGTKRGLSVVYSQVDSVVTFVFETGANRTTDSSDFFGTSGRMDYAKSAFGEDAHKMIASFNLNTKAGTMHYAWQAGSGDGAVRTFAVNVAEESAGAQTGLAYFGFGAAVGSIGDTTSTMWATNMRCNWLNGVSSSVQTAKLQAQTFSRTTTADWTVSTSKIDYAPTDNCTKSGSYNVTDYNSQTPTFLIGTFTRNTHELVDAGSEGAIPAVTVPTYTLPTE